MQINGIGITLLGVGAQDEQNCAIATEWFTFLYFPALPLKRMRVEFLPHKGSGFSYRILETLALNLPEIARTYLLGWGVIPGVLLGPLFVAVTEVWRKLGLPEDWQLPYIIGCCLWLGLGVWKLSDWQEARCHPKFKVAESK